MKTQTNGNQRAETKAEETEDSALYRRQDGKRLTKDRDRRWDAARREKSQYRHA